MKTSTTERPKVVEKDGLPLEEAAQIEASTCDNASSARSSAMRSRRQTEKRLLEAIERLQLASAKISISSVALEAKVTPALIHNTYPDIAECIRGLIGKTIRSVRDAKHDALMKERARNRALRAEVDRLRMESAKLASINLSLLSKLAVFNETGNGKVVAFSDPEEPN